MTNLIVDAFEEVDVDDANAKDVAGSIATILFCLQRGHKNAAVENAGQLVPPCLIFNILQLDARVRQVFPQPSDIAADSNEPRHSHGEDEPVHKIAPEHFRGLSAVNTQSDDNSEASQGNGGQEQQFAGG